VVLVHHNPQVEVVALALLVHQVVLIPIEQMVVMELLTLFQEHQ
jgi:hypothetical protein